jgi:MbtH protein
MTETESGHDEAEYKVVQNHEDQFSIWPTAKENPLGWRNAGMQGNKEDCLTYITKVWTDMRPLSLRKAMKQN